MFKIFLTIKLKKKIRKFKVLKININLKSKGTNNYLSKFSKGHL